MSPYKLHVKEVTPSNLMQYYHLVVFFFFYKTIIFLQPIRLRWITLLPNPKRLGSVCFTSQTLNLRKYFISLFLNKVWLLNPNFLNFLWKSCDIWKQSYKSFKDRKLPLEQFPGSKTLFWSVKTIFLTFGLQNPVHEILVTAPLFFKNL